PELFGLHNRALSSGCVRVEQPRLLAEKLLRGQQGWTRRHIDSAIDQNRTTRIRLQEEVPVYLMYWTTWVDEKGTLQVRDDVYQRDLIAGLPPINPEVSLYAGSAGYTSAPDKCSKPLNVRIMTVYFPVALAYCRLFLIIQPEN